MRRFVVTGTSGSGKTTFAGRLADAIGCPHVELDALHWEPSWKEAETEVLRARVDAATAGESWVVDGNYPRVRDVVWGRAEALIWLDYSFARTLWQVTWRTLRRGALRQELWSGNRESLLRNLFTRESVIWWMITTWGRRRRDFPRELVRPEWAHLTVRRVRTPAQAEALLAELSKDPQ